MKNGTSAPLVASKRLLQLLLSITLALGPFRTVWDHREALELPETQSCTEKIY